jgi:aspartyl/asparaginyl beta-hydroxylase (cupin superfamily)
MRIQLGNSSPSYGAVYAHGDGEYKRAMDSPTQKKKSHQISNGKKLMARTKEQETEWQSHRDELKALWLDQRWTLEQIQEHMSQRHSFRKRSVSIAPRKLLSPD